MSLAGEGCNHNRSLLFAGPREFTCAPDLAATTRGSGKQQTIQRRLIIEACEMPMIEIEGSNIKSHPHPQFANVA